MSEQNAASPQTLILAGEMFVVLPIDEYERLKAAAGEPQADEPPLPAPAADGNVPAVPYARATLARKIIRRRPAIGMTQAELARRARMRPETLARIERGAVTPSVGSIERLERELKSEAARG